MGSNRRNADPEPKVEIYYAPDGSEYPVNPDTLTPVEATNLRAWGYSTTKPDAADAEANAVPIPDAGPLSGAATPPGE